MATSEYITPASSPPTSVSMKKLIARPSMHGAEIGGEHRGVLPHRIGRSVGDLAAVVEDDDVARQSHDDPDVVLDQHDGRAELAVDVGNEPAHLALLLLVHAGHRLVEQQQLRLAGERAGEGDPLL